MMVWMAPIEWPDSDICIPLLQTPEQMSESTDH
jgi:hypothetical protein